MEKTPPFEASTCPSPYTPKTIVLGHGSGGTLSHELLHRYILPGLAQSGPLALDDAAVVEQGGQGFALTTDSHVVSPLFFPGGDIGRLAVCGTVNDLAMMGARPLALTSALIMEEGLPFTVLQQVLHSMQEAAAEAGVAIAAGDTKVVQRGGVDKLFINTSGLGLIAQGCNISGAKAQEGDVIILSGSLGDHGIAVLSAREHLQFETTLTSDVAPLNHLVAAMLAAGRVHVLRDPTRGGVATSLVEIAQQSHMVLAIEEEQLPIKAAVRAACEMLGLDPLFIANEGKLLALVPAEDAPAVLAAMHKNLYGAEAAVIGRVLGKGKGQVRLHTAFGGTRQVDMLPGELLPRIC